MAAKKRVVILGGGMSALTAALYLTQGPNAEKYDVTIYQRGWRLGGKGASGRNAHHGQRIEEHGLHIWLGFYENAFRLYRDVFKSWKRRPGHPWQRWDRDAFTKWSDVPLFEKDANGKWNAWEFRFPENTLVPGDGERLSLWKMLGDIRELLESLLDLDEEESAGVFPSGERDGGSDTAVALLTRMAELQRYKRDARADESCAKTLAEMREVLHSVPRNLEITANEGSGSRDVDGAVANLERMSILSRKIVSEGAREGVRRIGILTQLLVSLLAGLVANLFSIWRDGLDALDDLEFREFLKKYGASDEVLFSPIVSSWYDLVFGYLDGDWRKEDRANCAAGVAIRGLYRMTLTYKGAVFWKMQAGMGDTVFTPIFDVLKERSVKFRFFHDVRRLRVSVDGDEIERIEMERQASVVGGADYKPLVLVKGLDCWPSAPLVDQLVEREELSQGDELPEGGYDLESDFSTWREEQSLEKVVLERRAGGDQGFDHVILGISVGAFEQVCSDLIEHDWRFKKMVSRLKTVRTQGLQVWLDKTLKDLGWEGDPPIGTNFQDPLNTWADMTHLADKETPPAGEEPLQVSYFCGPMRDDEVPNGSKDIIRKTRALVDAYGRSLLKEMLHLWPNAGKSGDFDWSILLQKYVRANISASDRYVLSVSGSTEARLEARGSQFRNLILAGDWTRNNFNAGCIEAATMSGMQASHAISGFPKLDSIIGNDGP